MVSENLDQYNVGLVVSLDMIGQIRNQGVVVAVLSVNESEREYDQVWEGQKFVDMRE